MMDSKFVKTVGRFYFFIVAVLFYYFLTEVIEVGLFITYRHAFALVLFVSTFLAFLYKPNIARFVSSVGGAFVYALPLLVTLFASLFIWFVGQADTEIISRGLSSSFVYVNMASFTLAAVAFLYVFGEKGVWYNLLAILTANILMLITIMAENGVGPFFSELVALVVTFAEETGEIIVQAEIHELAFCLGAYLIYMLLKPKRDTLFWILFALAGFCFIAAFKRIGIIAIVLAVGIGWILRVVARLKADTARWLSVFISVMVVLILIGYVYIIKLDVFTLLEEIGINTSGRMGVYRAVDKFYEFHPGFLGHGIGFLTYQLNTNIYVDVHAVHNDFLQYYIDLGFWGYILWLVSITVVRVCYFGRKGRVDGGIVALALTLYLVIISSTDNTMNYPLLTTVLAVIMIGDGFDDKVRKTEEKMFGCVSDANKKSEGGSIL